MVVKESTERSERRREKRVIYMGSERGKLESACVFGDVIECNKSLLL